MSERPNQPINQVIADAVGQGVPRRVAGQLLLFALKQNSQGHAWLLSHDLDVVPANGLEAFSGFCERWFQHEPLEYILNSAEFFGLRLFVDHRVLVPRPDTETLVDWALEVLKGTKCPRVVDLGTGSGAIALAIKYQQCDADVLAVDASTDALVVAQRNATQLNLHVQFVQGSWLEPLSQLSSRAGSQDGWELIVSNPPYIAEDDDHLPALKHEPRQALTSGSDGLDDLRIIVADAPQHLTLDGWLLLEHGFNQAPAVQELMQERGFVDVQTRNDLAGVARCTGGRWRPAHKAG